MVVQKVLIFLHERFNPKVLAIEEMTNISIVNRDKLLGILTPYETRISKRNSPTKESTLKEENECKDENDDSCCESIEEESNLLRKLKRGWTVASCIYFSEPKDKIVTHGMSYNFTLLN